MHLRASAVGLVLAAGAGALLLHAAHPATRAGVPGPQATPAQAAGSAEFYTAHVQPIFQANCYRCHAGLNHRGGLRMDSQSGLLHGGHDGVVLVPGHPEQSLLVKLIRHEGPPNDPMPMPPKSKLSDADIRTIEQWVGGGAGMPPDATASQ